MSRNGGVTQAKWGAKRGKGRGGGGTLSWCIRFVLNAGRVVTSATLTIPGFPVLIAGSVFSTLARTLAIRTG